MSKYNGMVLTRQGRVMLAKIMAGECDMTITRAVTGDGLWEAGDDLAAAEALKSQVQSFGISAFKREGEQILIRFITSNFDAGTELRLTNDYYIREVGIYAKENGTENEFLYGIVTSDVPAFMPAYDENAPVTITFNTYVYVGDGEKVVIQADPAAYALAVDLLELSAKQQMVVSAAVEKMENELSAHNVSEAAHDDIRRLVADISTRVNTALNSDDITLDQLSEIVDYIKNNRGLIDGITTSKVSVSDIVDNLTSTADKKPLSAKQGKVLKGELDTVKKSVSDGKKNVAAAITAKGVSTVSTDENPATFDTLASNIQLITPVITVDKNIVKATVGDAEKTTTVGYNVGAEIYPGTSDYLIGPKDQLLFCQQDYVMKSLGGDASVSHVLAGKTFSSDVSGREKTGTMTNQGAVSKTLNCGETYTIPAGYHDGDGKVKANSLASQTAPDSGKSAAGAAQILTGYQAFVNGSKVSGTMTNRGAVAQNQNGVGGNGLAEVVYTIPAGYHNGAGKIKTFGAVGTYGGDPSTIKLVEAGTQPAAFLWKRDAKLSYTMSLGTEYNVASGTYQNYRVMNFRGDLKAELSNPSWKCTNRSVIIFIRQYILKNGVYALNNAQNAVNAIYVQHGQSVKVQETASNVYLTFSWDAANGKIGMAVEGSSYIMHDLYIHIL